ncbi:MAG: nucleotidyl transferase AbiEii/AbiGii toxin family protein, partial [Candidatus Tenebribacter davisii]|nr:nucleotidyl transferase AbiEii/AbiGii toxin family protein [Candidatus Tenebribacter davisii]
GKIHALLCRSWGNRVKGRDFYDYIWYLSKNIKVDLVHLSNRMKQTNHLKDEEILSKKMLINMLLNKFTKIDFQQAKRDVLPFIRNTETLELWSEDFFKKITEDKLTGVDDA